MVVYRPPGQLGNFLEKLYVLLSNFPKDGTPLVLLGDFNIHLEKPQVSNFNTLLTSFDLKRVSTMAIHKSGNQLDLIYTRYCSTDNTLVTPLHTSDHFLITSNLTLPPDIAHTPLQVTFRRNLRSLALSLSLFLNGFILTSFTLSVFSTGHKQCNWHSLLHSNILLRQLLPPFIQTSMHYTICPLAVRCALWTSL